MYFLSYKKSKKKLKTWKSKKIEKFLKFKKKTLDSRIPVFHFPQFEHQPFWSYLSQLNDYRPQLNQNFQKWKICEVIAVGLNSKSWGYIESLYPGGVLWLLSKTQDEVWNFFEKLA